MISGWLAPAGTPDDTVPVLNNAMKKILQNPQLKSKRATLGNELFIASPQDSQAFIEKEIKFWGEAAKASGVKPSKL